jgi:hypothetical protein
MPTTAVFSGIRNGVVITPDSGPPLLSPGAAAMLKKGL